MSGWSLVNKTTEELVVRNLEVADSFWDRFKGLQFRRGLARDSGLLLVPCGSIHTMFMRFPIDVVMLSSKGEILLAKRSLKPWSMQTAPPGTFAVLELPAESASVEPGNVLQLTSSVQKSPRLPESLRFLCS